MTDDEWARRRRYIRIHRAMQRWFMRLLRSARKGDYRTAQQCHRNIDRLLAVLERERMRDSEQ